MVVDRFHQSFKKWLSFFCDPEIGLPLTLGSQSNANSAATTIVAANALSGTHIAIMLSKILYHSPQVTIGSFSQWMFPATVGLVGSI